MVEGDDPEPHARTLRFKLSQNASVVFDSREFTVPVSPRSMSGYVALHKKPLNIADVYDLPALAPYGFDRSFDAKIGYRTKSMLCAPLLSRVGDVVGVLQLLNKKRDPERRLLGDDDVGEQVVPFDERSEELLATLASQAGIALENAILYAEIQRMLEGFVRASVEAIEQRDPTTSGHSRRVSDLTVGLARAVERADAGPYRGVTWSAGDLRELEYASLLHDFGKIGVREQVLLKAKKLFPAELENIRGRFELATRSAEVDVLSRKVRLLERGAPAAELAALDEELRAPQARARRRVRPHPRRQRADSAQGRRLRPHRGARAGDLRRPPRQRGRRSSCRREVACLSVARGSLTAAEIDEIRSHVSHTFTFLSQIPWGKQFRRVAHIAGAHHERLNGTGYPAPAARRGDPAPVQDDGGERHLRRAHRQRPALQEGRARSRRRSTSSASR